MVKTIAFGIMAMSVIGFATGLNAAQEYITSESFGVMSSNGAVRALLMDSKQNKEGVLNLISEEGYRLVLSPNMLIMSDTSRKIRFAIRVTDNYAEMGFFDKDQKVLKMFRY